MSKNSEKFKAFGGFNLRRILKIFYAVCILSLILDFIIYRDHNQPWEWILFFYCIFGFVACVVLVLFAKVMRVYLMRSENYYDRD